MDLPPTYSFSYLIYFKNEKDKLNIEFRRLEIEPEQLISLSDVQVYLMENLVLLTENNYEKKP